MKTKYDSRSPDDDPVITTVTEVTLTCLEKTDEFERFA
jgi:hypothetical protein